MRLYSSINASSSLRTSIQVTDSAVATIWAVRGAREAGFWKYEDSRDRRLFAFPT
jgi:hypothetical protein